MASRVARGKPRGGSCRGPTAWLACVFIACGTPAPPPPPRPPPPPPITIDAAPRTVTITPDAPSAPTLGMACGTCDGGQTCLALPHGYCTSTCGLAGGPCAGACVETPRDGELCMAACSSDADCRTDDDYRCDPVWHACAIGNTTAIVPRACGELPGYGRDPAFAPATALTTATTPGLYQTSPTAALADDGTVVALAQTSTGALVAARVDPLGRITQAAAIAEGATDPGIARDGKRLYAVWRAHDGAMLASSTDRGATWSEAKPVHDPADCTNLADCPAEPIVVTGVDAARKPILYVAYTADNLRVRASRDGGATFSPPRTAVTGARGSLATDARGVLYAVGITDGDRGGYGTGDRKLEFAISTDGARSFTRPRTLSVPGESLPYYFATPRVEVDSARRWLYIVYVRGTRSGAWDLALLASNDGGGKWIRTRIGDDCAIHMAPAIALDPTTGWLHLAWYDSHGGRFAHAACTPGLAQCRQLGRINSEPITLSTVRNAPRWVGDHEALVIDGLRRTLHAVWAQPADGVARVLYGRAKLR